MPVTPAQVLFGGIAVTIHSLTTVKGDHRMDWNRDFDQDESLRMQTDISRLPEAKQR
jgi:hypothetical protein